MTAFRIAPRPMYDPVAVQPMRDELTAVGFEELLTPEEVDRVLGAQNDETILLMINSVCGCAAGSARPGATLALQHEVIPDRFVTVFAGQDVEAVEHVRRTYLHEYPPSSPAMALLRNGKVLYAMPRRQIEGRYAEDLAGTLAQVFDQHCRRKGPAISPEQYAQLEYAIACGAKIPRFSGN